ncbi:MAG: c-type cytochrome [Rhodocyclaceae bacterium]|jgi:cytochrome c553|nr:c-type cytochrome [Rhodocyclaceae bacterium]
MLERWMGKRAAKGLGGILMGLALAAPVVAAPAGGQGAPEAARALAEEGRKAAFFCANCHGASGHSKYPEVPNLAGQHPAYVQTQIEAFLSGKRKDPFMQGLMKVLSERDKAAIAQFYATSPAQPAVPTPGARAAEGAGHFQRLCARCHQADARGGETFPRLAGQQPEYLRRTLKRYLTLSGERFFAPMTAAVMQLEEKNIEAVVDYLASLQ